MDELLARLRRFHEHTFPGVQDRFAELVEQGQRPTILFIGCSDSRLMGYPMVRDAAQEKRLTQHGWHCVIEDGKVHVFVVHSGGFVPASRAEHSGAGPFREHLEQGPGAAGPAG